MQFLEMVNEISQLVDGQVSPVTIKMLINRVIREISAKALFDANIGETTVTTVASTESYALPSDFSREVAAIHTNVLDYEPWFLYAQRDRTTDGVPSVYTIQGANIFLNPPPTSAAATTDVTLVYGKQPTDLTTDTSEPVLPRNFHWVIKEGALLQALRSVPAGADDGGRFAAMIPLTKETYESGVLELIASEANKGRLSLTPRG